MPKVRCNGYQLYYEQAGEGPPLLFLSGLGGDHRAFSRSLRSFAAHYWTLALDARDTGQSDRSVAPYSTADLGDDVACFLSSRGGPPAHVVGHSLGGLVAQKLALRHPS